MEIKYVFQHTKDGDIQEEIFSIEYIEKLGINVLEFINRMNKDGYTLIDRKLISNDNDFKDTLNSFKNPIKVISINDSEKMW